MLILRRVVRFALAVIAGCILGNVIAIVAAFGIDASYGAQVTGGRWPFTWPNVLYAIIQGLFIGVFAGFIAQKRGKVVGAVAQVILLVFFIALSLALNRNIFGAMQGEPETGPALWTWIGLIPAILGGAWGERTANDPESMELIKGVRWHWLWVWIPLTIFLYSLAGSIRFLIADLVVAWEILFIPRLWFLYLFGLPTIITLFYFTFSLPMTSTTVLLVTLAHGTNLEDQRIYGFKRVRYVCIWAVGVPLALAVIWLIDVWILRFLLSRGFRLP